MWNSTAISISWRMLIDSHIAGALVLTVLCFLSASIITAYEIICSSPPRPSSARQTPSPYATYSNSYTSSSGGFSSRNGRVIGSQKPYMDSPESLEDGVGGLGGNISNPLTRSTSGSGSGGGGGNNSNNNLGNGGSNKPRRTSIRQKQMSAAAAASLSSGGYGSVMRGFPTLGGNRNADDTVGGGSNGDHTRRSFYNFLLVALSARMLLLPFEAIFVSNSIDANKSSFMFTRTLPDVVFASAFSLLVLFYAQLAGTASGGPRGISLILLRPGYFRNGNFMMYGLYFFLLILTMLYPGRYSQSIFQSVVWLVLGGLYVTLLILMSYFGCVLLNLLRPSLKKRSALAIRIKSMCAICSFIFFARSISYTFGLIRQDIRFTHGLLSVYFINVSHENDSYIFQRDCLGYILLELIPSLAILFMMHQNNSSGPSSSPAVSQSQVTQQSFIMVGGGDDIAVSTDGMRYSNIVHYTPQNATMMSGGMSSSSGVEVGGATGGNSNGNAINRRGFKQSSAAQMGNANMSSMMMAETERKYNSSPMRNENYHLERVSLVENMSNDR